MIEVMIRDKLPKGHFSHTIAKPQKSGKITIHPSIHSHILMCYTIHIHYIWEKTMATNLAIDDNLLVTAQSIAGMKTKKETVNQALKEFVQRRRQEEVIDLFGTIEYDEDYDYKEMRNRK
jgi:Arc/MetJ family transcription regulator